MTLELEADSTVTHVKILAIYETLLQHLVLRRDDHPTVENMKKAASEYVASNEREVLPKNYDLWAFFDPRFKNFNHFKTINKESILRRIKTEVERMGPLDTNNNDILDDGVQILFSLI